MMEIALLGAALACVIGSLGMGLTTFIRSGPSSQSEFWMRTRIVLQGVAIALLGLFFYGRL